MALDRDSEVRCSKKHARHVWSFIVKDDSRLISMGLGRDLHLHISRTYELEGVKRQEVAIGCKCNCKCNEGEYIWRYLSKDIVHNGILWFEKELESLVLGDHGHWGSNVKSAGKHA